MHQFVKVGVLRIVNMKLDKHEFVNCSLALHALESHLSHLLNKPTYGCKFWQYWEVFGNGKHQEKEYAKTIVQALPMALCLLVNDCLSTSLQVSEQVWVSICDMVHKCFCTCSKICHHFDFAMETDAMENALEQFADAFSSSMQKMVLEVSKKADFEKESCVKYLLSIRKMVLCWYTTLYIKFSNYSFFKNKRVQIKEVTIELCSYLQENSWGLSFHSQIDSKRKYCT